MNRRKLTLIRYLENKEARLDENAKYRKQRRKSVIHSVIRSDRLINFSHFTFVLVPVFPLSVHYYGRKSKSGVNKKKKNTEPFLVSPLMALLFAVLITKDWKKKELTSAFSFSLICLICVLENARALLPKILGTCPQSPLALV